MRRIATLAIALVVVLLVAAQLAIPPIADRTAEHRLTRDGGSADVHLSAFPALRLLFKEGHSARVRARGISLPLIPSDPKVFEDLDGFDEVDIQVADATMGPFHLSTLTLQRKGDTPYRATVRGTVTGRDLATFAGAQIGGPLGGFLGGLGGSAMPFGDAAVPLDLDAVLASVDGRPQAVTVHGAVAGVAAGPLIEAFAQGLAGRF
jgi:hypothetical protein